MSTVLPLEGLTIEWVAKLVKGLFLQPAISASLLLASVMKPEDANRFLSIVSKGTVTPALFKKVVKVLLALGLSYRLNNLLTRTVLNNFVSDKSWDWRREVVLVTGGCGGIGELIVNKLAESDVKVVILDIVEPRKQLASNTTFYKVDISSSAAIQETAEKIRTAIGHPTVLINNAGVGSGKAILEESEEEMRRTFNVNLIAHFLLVKEFVPDMVKNNHGHIVTVASMASFFVHAGNVDYCCTKAGVLALHEGLGQELKARYNAFKVRTTVVHPTWVRTPLIEKLMKKKDFKEFVLEPATVANAVVAQLYKGRSAQLILPGRLGMIPSVRGWPSWLQESMRNSAAGMLLDM